MLVSKLCQLFDPFLCALCKPLAIFNSYQKKGTKNLLIFGATSSVTSQFFPKSADISVFRTRYAYDHPRFMPFFCLLVDVILDYVNLFLFHMVPNFTYSLYLTKSLFSVLWRQNMGVKKQERGTTQQLRPRAEKMAQMMQDRGGAQHQTHQLRPQISLSAAASTSFSSRFLIAMR